LEADGFSSLSGLRSAGDWTLKMHHEKIGLELNVREHFVWRILADENHLDSFSAFFISCFTRFGARALRA
jgi:hypothetical protein